jgi:hypothetical protein
VACTNCGQVAQSAGCWELRKWGLEAEEMRCTVIVEHVPNAFGNYVGQYSPISNGGVR